MSSSSCSSDRSYIASWENFVTKNGSLFYMEYTNLNENSFTQQCLDHKIEQNSSEIGNRNSFGRSSAKNIGDKFFRFIGTTSRKDNIKKSTNQKSSRIEKRRNKQQLVDKIIEIEFLIPRSNNFNLSNHHLRLTESILGIETSILPNGNLIISSIQQNSQLDREKSIKIGDLLKSINNYEVNSKNIGEILQKLIENNKVTLRFQRNSISEIERQQICNSIEQVHNYETFTIRLVNSVLELEQESFKNVVKLSVIILPKSGDDIIFCYPSRELNPFCNAKGSFLTLISILKSEFNTEPVITTILFEGNKYNLCYSFLEETFTLITIPEKLSSKHEAILLTNLVLNYIQFSCSMSKLFKEKQENEYGESFKNLDCSCKILEAQLIKNQLKYTFESILPEQSKIFLPKEAQLKILDALSEMEAMDYRDWIEEPLNSHREFYILGSALFYKTNLLESTLPTDILKNLKTVLCLQGIYEFVENKIIKEFVYWSEIFIKTIKFRKFLVICIRNNLILSTILVTFEKYNDNKCKEPPLFYIEEIQETLDHLRCLGGIDALAKVWETSNKRPETIQNLSGTEDMNSLDMSSSNLGSLAPSISLDEESDSDGDWDGFPKSYKSSSGFDISELKKSFLREVSDVLPISITAGEVNVLLRYVNIDYGYGIIMSSSNRYNDLIENKFKSACQFIHSSFVKIQNNRKHSESFDETSHQSSKAVKEHGIRHFIKDELGNEKEFWTIGRLFDAPMKEMYVCHSSDIPQNMVEMNFRLTFLTDG